MTEQTTEPGQCGGGDADWVLAALAAPEPLARTVPAPSPANVVTGEAAL